MDDRVRIEIEVDPADLAALSDIASDHAVSVGDLAAEAVRARVDQERDWEEAVREGLADSEAGRTISHDDYLSRAAERRRRWLAARTA